MTTVNFLKLKAHILKSENKSDFNEARKEWMLDYIVVTEVSGSCPCGQKIKEHCHLKNKLNQKTTFVGNVCVHRFIEIDARPIFRGLKAVQKSNIAKPNVALIEYANGRGFLYGENEFDFLQNIKRKRSLSEAQESWLTKINRRIVGEIVVKLYPVDATNILNLNEHNTIFI